MSETKPTPGPWHILFTPEGQFEVIEPDNLCRIIARGHADAEGAANGRLIRAAPALRQEAQVLRCLATSPRFHTMTVADALKELAANGCGHDGGAALALAQ